MVKQWKIPLNGQDGWYQELIARIAQILQEVK